MGTRATIRFKDGGEEYFVYRGHDGYPSNVETDINECIGKCKGRWAGAEIGQLVSLFIAFNYRQKDRLASYELTQCFHGDESYRYFVTWDNKDSLYKVDVQ